MLAMERTLVASATNVLASGFQVVPTDRRAPTGEPVNALFAVARAFGRVLEFKRPARAIAVIGSDAATDQWPPLLAAQLPALAELVRAYGFHVVEAPGEAHVVASYVAAARSAGDDVMVIGRDKRFAQLVTDHVWWYDSNKDVRYTPEIVQKRFLVPANAVAGWLALVGDDDSLPGVKGIGAKGATALIEAHGSVEAALAKSGEIDGRVGKALRAAGEDATRELARARLDSTRSLPLVLAACTFTRPDAGAINALLGRLGFAELLVAAEPEGDATVCSEPGSLGRELARLGSGPLALHALIEDPEPLRGEIVGIAVAAPATPACYVARASAAWSELATWLADPAAPKLGHDLLGTIVALRRLGIDLAGLAGDSMCASHLSQPSNWAPHDLLLVAKHVLGRAMPDDDRVRGVGRQRRTWASLPVEQAARIAGQRAEVAAALWAELAPRIEHTAGGLERGLLGEYMELMQTCARMELDGLSVDPAALDRAQESFAAIEAELTQQIEAHAGHSFNINSSQQLGTVLFEELKLPIAGHTKTGWSTSIEALEKIDHAHPIVPLVIRWRLLRRMRDFWVVALRRCIDDDGRVHSRSHPARSFSGHLVNSNPDLSRVPGRTLEMQLIRRAFVAPPGWLLMSVDFNQLGLHVLAHLTEDPALVEPLRARADMHRLTASAVLAKPIDQLRDDDRQLGKVINFATFAGQGASALALQLGVSAAEAKELITRFDAHYARVRAFQDEQLQLARERGYIVTLAGRRWPIGGLESLDSHDRSYAERLARRATHEGSVADVARRALLHADRALRAAGLRAGPRLQIVDEVVFEVPEGELAEAARLAAHAMAHAFALLVPLVVGVEAGRTWAELEPVNLP
jgi:DNA polymerase-1